MKKQSLEHQIISKLNKILMNTDIKFKIDGLNRDCVLMTFSGDEIHCGWWRNLAYMLFDDTVTIFEHIHELDKHNISHEGFEQFHEAGLMTLEGCSSLEEVLLKLDVMFPGV